MNVTDTTRSMPLASRDAWTGEEWVAPPIAEPRAIAVLPDGSLAVFDPMRPMLWHMSACGDALDSLPEQFPRVVRELQVLRAVLIRGQLGGGAGRIAENACQRAALRVHNDGVVVGRVVREIETDRAAAHGSAIDEVGDPPEIVFDRVVEECIAITLARDAEPRAKFARKILVCNHHARFDQYLIDRFIELHDQIFDIRYA